MRLKIDNELYQLSLSKTVEKVREMYQMISTEGLTTSDGKVIKFGDRSIARTALKALMTPIVIPFLNKLYAERGIILDPPVKHTDLIDYCMNSLLDFIKITEQQLDVNFTSQANEYSGKTIIAVSPSWQEQLTIESSTYKDSTEND